MTELQLEPQFGDEAFTLLWTGLRRADKHHVSSVGSDYPLLQLCEEITEATKAFAPKLRTKGKIAGYLSAYGGMGVEAPRWTSQEGVDGTEPPTSASAAVSILREAQWRATPDQAARSVPWTAGLISTVAATLQACADLDVRHAHSVHLALGVFADPGNRACEALAAATDVARDTALARLTGLPTAGIDAEPWVPAVARLSEDHALADARPGLFGRIFHHHDVASTSPALQVEAVRQAVRAGASQVDERHLLLAVLSLHEQLTIAGKTLAESAAPDNRAGELLAPSGLTAATLAATLQAPDLLPPSWPQPDVSAWTSAAAAAARGAVGTTEVLARLLDQPAAAALLERTPGTSDALRQSMATA